MTRRRRPVAVRFEAKVDRSGDCHLWTGAKRVQRDGLPYGHLKGEDRRMILAHRLAWELAFGPIPPGLQVDHVCRVRLCVNPAHLRLATQKQNAENLGVQRNSPTGYRGVRLTRYGRFQATVGHNRRTYCGGTYDTAEEAAKAAAGLRAELFTHSAESDGRVQV
jgi:hypothetical protein